MNRQCLQNALRMIGRRDHGIQEMRVKLRNKGFSPAEVEAALAECIRLDYLDDEKFAAVVVRAGRRQGYGPSRIAQKLKSKGIAADLIARTLAEHFDAARQADACRQVLEKKIRTRSVDRKDSAQYKAALYRFLHARGFSADIIRQALSIQAD